MSEHTPITNLGAILVESISRGGKGSGTINIPSVDSKDTFVVANNAQDIYNKCLEDCVFKIRDRENDNEYFLEPPKDLTDDAIIATTAYVDSRTENNDNLVYQKERINRLLDYLENWINVGNVSMTGITDIVNFGDNDFAFENLGHVDDEEKITLKILKIPDSTTVRLISCWTDTWNQLELTIEDNYVKFIPADFINDMSNCLITFNTEQICDVSRDNLLKKGSLYMTKLGEPPLGA